MNINISEKVLAYTAGILDGEGSICIAKVRAKIERGYKSPYHWLYIQVVNCDERLITWLKDTHGGSTLKIMRKCVRWHPVYRWQLQSREACRFLQLVTPYLLLKKKQAELAIDFQQAKKFHSLLPQEELNKRDWYRTEISKLCINPRMKATRVASI